MGFDASARGGRLERLGKWYIGGTLIGLANGETGESPSTTRNPILPSIMGS